MRAGSAPPPALPAAGLPVALLIIGLAGCAAPPVPCAVADDGLAVTAVDRDDAGFRVTVANRAGQPLTEKVFVEVAIVQAGQPVLAGATATTASWPAGGSVTLALPFTVDTGLAPAPASYETFTHLKCLSE